MESVALGRTNIAPQKLPWEMIRTLITETYGGKIDDEGDFARLTALVGQFMIPAAFESEHKLIGEMPSGGHDGGEEGLPVPAGTAMKDFMDWVNRLPEREPPTYLGLPANAEKLLLVGDGRSMIGNLRSVTKMLDEGEQIMAEAA